MNIRSTQRFMRATLAFALAAAGALFMAMPGAATAAEPELNLYMLAPDGAQAGEQITIGIGVENAGDAVTSGPIVVSDTASAGLSAPTQSAQWSFLTASTEEVNGEHVEHPRATCSVSGATFTCEVEVVLPPGAQLHLNLLTAVEASAEGSVTNDVTVTGGGAPPAHAQQAIMIGEPQPFGFDRFAASFAPSPLAGLQAGSVPTDFTTSLQFRSNATQFGGIVPLSASPEHFKNVLVDLPPGLIGNPTATPLCTAAELAQQAPGGHKNTPRCPDDSQVGVAHLTFGPESSFVGLYNMVAPPGAATELGFQVLGTIITLDAYVRPGDSGIDIVSRNTSTTLTVAGVEVTVWGDPASHAHDSVRGACLDSSSSEGATGGSCASHAPERAFLRLPTSCAAAGLAFEASANSFEKPKAFVGAHFDSPPLVGCGTVPFAPAFDVAPTGNSASSPTGLSVRLSLPQNSNPEGLGEADLKKVVVTLPEGMAINPSAANGLQACSDAQLHLGEAAPAECPAASRIGSVLLHTPLLEEPIEGFVYIRSQGSYDPESGEMFRMVTELRDDARGIDIKLPMFVAANAKTGELTTTVDDAPQLPFGDITLRFKSGARSPLVTAASCVTQTTTADLYSWAQPTVPVHRKVSFELTAGPEGSACASPRPFSPAFDAGVKNVQAGSYTPFLTTFSRDDAEQQLTSMMVRLPPGVMGSLTGLPLCGEGDANAGTCPAASQIGTVTAGAGVGPSPFYVTGGRVYLTGPYEGAPFGLSVVVPAKAGPFELGTVVVRAKVEVDRHTAQLTVVTDPLPQVVSGVPVDLRLVNVSIDRKDFTFNPTSCAPAKVTATVNGDEGASVGVENHFQVANCAVLPFAPVFKASTRAHHTRRDGAYLHVSVESGAGQADIGYAKVALPKALPSELKTLQHACTEAQFDVNPAGCPAESDVGTAEVDTPVLPVPLRGPAYFVSRGAQWPELIMVLQGYGVTVDLAGETHISKGVTTTTLASVPDVPFTRFSLTLPEKEYSALAGNGNLCAKELVMPVRFVGQNGKTLEQDTQVQVKGCPAEIAIASHRLKGKTVSLRVYVPSAGRLRVSGNGLVGKTLKPAGRKTITVKLREKHAGGRRLKTKVHLTFTSSEGKSRKRQIKSLEVRFK